MFTIYVVLDTLVLSSVYQDVEVASTEEYDTSNASITDNTYKDDNIEINISTVRKYDTNIYIADIKLKDSSYLKTAFANNSYGKNITAKTSTIANDNNAILAINGDYYGVQESGYVLKNGVIYRNTTKSNQEDLVIYKDGSFEIINESDTDINDLLDKGAWNILSFGPALITNNNISVSETEEVGKAMASNPRTAIGVIDDLHYVFVVSDGRTDESEGLSLYQLATILEDLDVETAYNLDGGGSSTMYFNGEIVNTPVSMRRNSSERSVSDIVYIG